MRSDSPLLRPMRNMFFLDLELHRAECSAWHVHAPHADHSRSTVVTLKAARLLAARWGDKI